MERRHAALPAKVLVVDDEPAIRFLCRVNLELEGHEVLEASSLAEARSVLAAGDIDVVLLDLHLGGERSAALIDECHAQQPPVPVVVVTGSVEPGAAGLVHADAVLPKPFELNELVATVSELSGVDVAR